MPPVSFLIKPASSLCNMRCKYCFYDDVSKNREINSYGIMNFETLEILLEKALSYADKRCDFAFQGGEPTLAGLDFFKKVIELQKKYNSKNVQINNAIQTNGYAINEEFAKFFAENSFLVGLSLDGNRELHDSLRVDRSGKGTFDKVINAAKLFNKYNVEYNILCVVNNFVARHSNQVYSFFKKNKFKYLQFIQCLDGFDGQQKNYSLTPERYISFLKNSFDNYYNDFISGNYTSIRLFDNYVSILAGRPAEACGMNGVCNCIFVIESDGSVYPCDFYVLDKYRLGNIRVNTFEEMCDNDIIKIFINESRFIDQKCCKCKWLNICRGGCRRCREPFIDGKPSLNMFCQSYYQFFDYAYDRMKKMATSSTYNNTCG